MKDYSRITRPGYDPSKEAPHREFYGFEDFDKIFGITSDGRNLFNKVTRQGAAKDALVAEKQSYFLCFNRKWRTKEIVWLLRYGTWAVKRLKHVNGYPYDHSEKNLLEDAPFWYQNLDRIEFDRRAKFWKVRIFPKSRQNRLKPVYYFYSLEEAIAFRDKNAIENNKTTK